MPRYSRFSYPALGIILAVLLAAPAAQAAYLESVFIECSGDITSDLQDAIDDYDGTTDYYGVIVISPSPTSCYVDDTIMVLDTHGLRIEGHGREGTVIEWRGGSTTPMFQLEASEGVTFARFTVKVVQNKTLESAFDLYNGCFSTTCPTGPYDTSHGNSFEDIRITAPHTDATLENGIRILLTPSEGDLHNEAHQFTNVHVDGYTDYGFVIEGRNSKENIFRGCHCRGTYATNQGQDQDHGLACVLTGYGDDDDAGSFKWYGGIANGNKDAAFVLGDNQDTVLISGANCEVDRMLLRAHNPDDPTFTRFPVIIDSVRFSDDAVHDWDGGTYDNTYGVIVDMRHRGPLVMRGNDLGRRVGSGSQVNLSICWSYGDHADSPIGGFVFEGNAIATSNANPFDPVDALMEDPPDCIYPTTQQSNIIALGSATGYRYAAMPEPFTELDTASVSSFSVNRIPSSHTRFVLDGTGNLDVLTDGTEGQLIVLVADDDVTVRDVSASSGNIILNSGANYAMGVGDTLTLVLYDGDWFEVARSTN